MTIRSAVYSIPSPKMLAGPYNLIPRQNQAFQHYYATSPRTCSDDSKQPRTFISSPADTNGRYELGATWSARSILGLLSSGGTQTL